MFEVLDFLSAEEAALVRDLASPTLARSGVKTTDGQNEKTAMNVRTSTNTFLERGQTDEITALEERVHRLTRTWYDEGEHIQVVRYLSEGQQMYEAHWDYFNPDQYRTQPMVIERMDLERRWVARTGVSRARAWPHCERARVRGRNRIATLFWYINSIPEGGGGETFFPRALDGKGQSITPWRYDYKDCSQGIKYPPKAGNGVLFYSMRPDGDLEEHSMHGGCPVTQGEKWGANLWLWSKPFVGRLDDYSRITAVGQEELWQLRRDAALDVAYSQSSPQRGQEDEGAFLYCPMSGRAVALGTALPDPERPDGKRRVPKVGTRCTGFRFVDEAEEAHGAGQVSVIVINDLPSAAEVEWRPSSGDGGPLTIQPGQRQVLPSDSVEDELVITPRSKGKKKRSRAPRPLRFLRSAGEAQTVLLSRMMGSGGSGRHPNRQMREL